jgi:hypothetical protein
MSHFNLMTDTLREGLVGIADWICGCSHVKTTFPITLRPKGKIAPAETYVVCLDCGRQLKYDWSGMRRARKHERFTAPAIRQQAEGHRAWPA